MKKAIIFPSKYIQGEGVLEGIGENVKNFGAQKAMVVWGRRTREASGDAVLASLKESGIECVEWAFEGECSKEQCAELEAKIKKERCGIVIGLGGGKCLDISKAAAMHLGLRVLICPTVCSSDAPTSACTVWYSPEGVCTGFDLWPVNPDAIIVDTGVMISAPEKMLKAGIGDALATYIEARAANRNHNIASSGGAPTMTAMAMARLCFDTLLEDTDAALISLSAGAVTPSFERVVEACTLLSGLGWESGGLATAHQLGNNLTSFREAHGAMHGEKVAFGIVTQLMLDPDVETDEVYEVVDFMASVGLAVCFEDLSMESIERERIMQWCEENSGEGAFTNKHSFPVSAKDLYNAMMAANAFGLARKAALQVEGN